MTKCLIAGDVNLDPLGKVVSPPLSYCSSSVINKYLVDRYSKTTLLCIRFYSIH